MGPVAFLVFLYLFTRFFFLLMTSTAALMGAIVSGVETKPRTGLLPLLILGLSSVLLFHGLVKLGVPEWVFYLISTFRVLNAYQNWTNTGTEVITPRFVTASLGPLWLLLWVEWEGFQVLFRY